MVQAAPYRCCSQDSSLQPAHPRLHRCECMLAACPAMCLAAGLHDKAGGPWAVAGVAPGHLLERLYRCPGSSPCTAPWGPWRSLPTCQGAVPPYLFPPGGGWAGEGQDAEQEPHPNHAQWLGQQEIAPQLCLAAVCNPRSALAAQHSSPPCCTGCGSPTLPEPM